MNNSINQTVKKLNKSLSKQAGSLSQVKKVNKTYAIRNFPK